MGLVASLGGLLSCNIYFSMKRSTYNPKSS